MCYCQFLKVSKFANNVYHKVYHLCTLSILDGYTSGPSPCGWLSQPPWVVVTPPTTTASLPHLSPILPKPAASVEEGQVVPR